jgi:hypothetical protein
MKLCTPKYAQGITTSRYVPCHDHPYCTFQLVIMGIDLQDSPVNLVRERELLSEVSALLTLDHPHIVRVCATADVNSR